MTGNKEKISSLFIISTIATSGMTFFSYLLSVKHKEKFLEPLALNQLIYHKNKEKKAHHLMGYLVHYLVGLFFSFFYFVFFSKSIIKLKWLNFSMLGFINGLIGASGWYFSLQIHGNPPKIKLKKYLLQLIGAHIIFGLINGAIYTWIKKE